jgi:hypothetical protein
METKWPLIHIGLIRELRVLVPTLIASLREGKARSLKVYGEGNRQRSI